MRDRRASIRTALVLAVGAGLFGGCGAATPAQPAAAAETVTPVAAAPATPAPTMAAASGIVLKLTARQPAGKDVGWDQAELRGPADMTFEVDYVNADAVRHDFAVLPQAGTLSDLVFKSEMVAASTSKLLAVPALRAGTYDFVCSLHASTMRGTLTIQ